MHTRPVNIVVATSTSLSVNLSDNLELEGFDQLDKTTHALNLKNVGKVEGFK